jgi:hypothetical protein
MLALFRKNKVDILQFTASDLSVDRFPNNVHEIMKLVQLTDQDLKYLSLIDDLMEEHAPIITK